MRYHQLAKALGVEPEVLTAAAAVEFKLDKEPVAIASVPEAVEAWLRETFVYRADPGFVGEVTELTSEDPPALEPATPEEIAVLEELAAPSLVADAEAFAEKAAEKALASLDLEPALETTPAEDVFQVVRFDGFREPDLHLEPGLSARVREVLAGRTIESHLLDLDRGLFIFVTQGQKYRVLIDE